MSNARDEGASGQVTKQCAIRLAGSLQENGTWWDEGQGTGQGGLGGIRYNPEQRTEWWGWRVEQPLPSRLFRDDLSCL